MERTLDVLEFDAVRQAVGECAASDLGRALIVTAARDAGFSYVAIDLEGYRTGSMNEIMGNG